MSKRIEIDGKYYRERRGKLVEIPDAWLGRITTPATIRKRPSKMTRKARNADGFKRRWNTDIPNPHGPPSMSPEYREHRHDYLDD